MDDFESELQRLTISWNTTKNIIQNRIDTFRKSKEKLLKEEESTVYTEILLRDYKFYVEDFDSLLAEITAAYHNVIIDARSALESAKSKLDGVGNMQAELSAKVAALEAEIFKLNFERSEMGRTFRRYAEVGLFDSELFKLHFPEVVGDKEAGEETEQVVE